MDRLHPDVLKQRPQVPSLRSRRPAATLKRGDWGGVEGCFAPCDADQKQLLARFGDISNIALKSESWYYLVFFSPEDTAGVEHARAVKMVGEPQRSKYVTKCNV